MKRCRSGVMVHLHDGKTKNAQGEPLSVGGKPPSIENPHPPATVTNLPTAKRFSSTAISRTRPPHLIWDSPVGLLRIINRAAQRVNRFRDNGLMALRCGWWPGSVDQWRELGHVRILAGRTSRTSDASEPIHKIQQR